MSKFEPDQDSRISPPLGIVAELTHRCPLACLYCSNPVLLVPAELEMNTFCWRELFDQASRLGVLQLHLTGGEPLLRTDLEALAEYGDELGLYINLNTSGLGLTEKRTKHLSRHLRSVQLSLQSTDCRTAARVCGRSSTDDKVRAAQMIVRHGLPLSWNVVLHRHNLNELNDIIELCASFGPFRIELAHVQYHGFALLHREQLLPQPEDVRRAETIVQRARDRYAEIEFVYVKSDWFEPVPKPCNGGWGNSQITVAPDGTLLPCAAARSIVYLDFEKFPNTSLQYAWYQSSSFNAFRGFDWMADPCATCPRKTEDYGGCRCQAFALAGDARQVDPACGLSPVRIAQFANKSG